MRERVDDTLPLHAMAEIAHLSPYHFTRVFRQVTGIPPGEFLVALRLERAKQLLLTDKEMLDEVAWHPKEKPLAFVCGPTPLVKKVAAGLVELGYEPARIKRPKASYRR